MARMRTTTWTTIDPRIAAAEERICADWNRLHGDADPRIWAYIDDVLSGRVMACQKVRLHQRKLTIQRVSTKRT